MATVTYIPEKTQSKTAMGKVMRYCSREDKTKIEQDGRQFQLISGKDCCGETAYKEFMATKHQYGKDHGMFFYQYVQSFSPDEKVTPQQAHEIGCKFAEYFEGHEVLIATHTDVVHIHTHLIINSVNHENGKKLQMARGSIHKLRYFSDEICRQYNLSIVKPKEQGLKNIRTREYRAALKGESWKFKLISAVDKAMEVSRSKSEFIVNMKKMGYGISWSDNRKHITYTTPEGQKCRDNKMHDEKYLKHNMEVYYEYGATKSVEQAGKPDRGLQYKDTNIRNSAGNIRKFADNVIGNRAGAGAGARTDTSAPDMGKSERRPVSVNAEIRPKSDRPYRSFNQKNIVGNSTAYGGADQRSQESYIRQDFTHGGKGNSEGFIPDKTQNDMDGMGRVDADSIIRIAYHIENIVNPYNPEKEREKKRQELEQRKKQSQKRHKSHDWGMEL